MQQLFTPYRLGRMTLSTRVVMAPMTRSRAIGGIPNDLMRTYYTQRAGAALIVTEGTAPSPDGLGYARIPGLFSREQIDGWRAITESVHAAGGRMVAQLMHVGRIAHPLNMPRCARIVAPSAVRAEGNMYTDQEGPQPHPVPEAMTAEDLTAVREAFARAADNAVEAGFDAVELHGANGYLLEQFLNPHTNQRSDAYGGSVEARARLVTEVASACADRIGADRVGIRLSPYNTFNDMPRYDEIDAQYVTLARALSGLLYVHLVAAPEVRFEPTARAMREAYGGPVILNGGFDGDRAEAALRDGRADLVAFGRPFIANPEAVARMREGVPLAAPDPATFYTPGPEGYVDYPA